MPNKRIVMRKIHEILRLRFEIGLSFRQISQCADVSTGAIQKMLKRLEASGISWPLPEGMSEPRLASLLYPESDSRPGALEDPNWAEIHMELRKKGVTLAWVSGRLAEKTHPEQAYRLCLGLLSLTREYPSERVNNSCRLANGEGLTRLKQIKSILKNNRDLVPADRDLHPSQELPQEHENIRGPRHFH